MKNIPRILPLVGVAVGGVLAVNALAGARDLPSLLSGARAFAEEAVKADPKAAGDHAKDASATLPAPSIKPANICAPTAAELAKEAGLSPAELKVLQSLGERRGQLDAREGEMDVNLALMAAAEAKLDAKIKALNGLKADVNGLLVQADTKEQAEIDRLVKVFEGMKAKDAAPRLAMLDDSVRLPIAAKMKERALSAIIAQMPTGEAKKLTEALAHRFSDARKLADAAVAAEAAPAKAEAEPAPAKQAAVPRRSAPRKAPAKRAAAQPAAAPAPTAAAAPAPAAAAPAAAPPTKAG